VKDLQKWVVMCDIYIKCVG